MIKQISCPHLQKDEKSQAPDPAKRIRLTELQNKLARMGHLLQVENSPKAKEENHHFDSFIRQSLCQEGLHEIMGKGWDQEEAVAPALFFFGLTKLWKKEAIFISHRMNIHPLGLWRMGVNPSSILFIETRNNKESLWAFEETLRFAGPSMIGAELEGLTLLESRRLHLAAQQSGGSGWALRRFYLGAHAEINEKQPIAALSRWFIRPTPPPQDQQGAFFQLNLWRHKGGSPLSWHLSLSQGQFHEISIPMAHPFPHRSLALAQG